VAHNMLYSSSGVNFPSICFGVSILNLVCLLLILVLGIADGNKYKGGIYMVFEYMDHDLTGLADRPGMRFTVPQIKVLLLIPTFISYINSFLFYCCLNCVSLPFLSVT